MSHKRRGKGRERRGSGAGRGEAGEGQLEGGGREGNQRMKWRHFLKQSICLHLFPRYPETSHCVMFGSLAEGLFSSSWVAFWTYTEITPDDSLIGGWEQLKQPCSALGVLRGPSGGLSHHNHLRQMPGPKSVSPVVGSGNLQSSGLFTLYFRRAPDDS